MTLSKYKIYDTYIRSVLLILHSKMITHENFFSNSVMELFCSFAINFAIPSGQEITFEKDMPQDHRTVRSSFFFRTCLLIFSEKNNDERVSPCTHITENLSPKTIYKYAGRLGSLGGNEGTGLLLTKNTLNKYYNYNS